MTRRRICPFCNCLCDDVDLELKGDFFSTLEPPCHLAEKGFSSSLSREGQALPELNNKSGPWVQALSHSEKLIREAHEPLIVLSGEVKFETQEKAVQLGEYLNACVDTSLSQAGAAIPSATNEIGLPKCSLGEMKRQADMVIFWGCDLTATHPRFLERFVRNEKKQKIFYIDPDSNDNLETAVQLRMHLKKKSVTLNDSLKEILTAAQSAKFGVFCYGQHLVDEGKETMTEVYHLIRELNSYSLWHGMDLHDFGNWLGAGEALSAKTGYCCSVRFSKDGYNFQPSDWSTEPMLLRKQTDLVILVGNPTWLSKNYLSHLAEIPTILLSEKRVSWSPEVWLPISQVGVHNSGTSFRLDGIPVQLLPVAPNGQYTTADKILDLFLGFFNI